MRGATETGRPYFVMELVRGIRITEYCDQNNSRHGQRLELFIQVCQADPARASKGHHPSGYQTFQHSRHAARWRARAQGD